MESNRLFLAVPLSEQIRDGIFSHLKTHCHGKSLPGRPVKPESWHFTLKFLGNVAPSQFNSLIHAVKNTPLIPPFELKFGGLGAFPRTAKATVLWIGLENGGEQLSRLAAIVEHTTSSVGFTPENRPYHPHLTLSRIRPPRSIDRLLSQVSPLGLEMTVDEIVLFKSHLSREGARYQAIERFTLNR